MSGRPPSTKSNAASGAAAAAAEGAAMTHVFLRVKRRRSPPAAAASRPSPCVVNDGGASTTCPDRIEIALPRAPADGVGMSAAKRRRIREKEELALVRRLDSAVSLRDDRGPPKNDGDGSIGGEDAAPRTPPRHRGGNNPYDQSPSPIDVANDGDETGDDAPRTPPSSAKMNSSTDGSLEQPAPPAKPRRTAIFRRIASVQKRLSPPGDPTDAGGSDPPDAAVSASWSPKGEERSKWLRVVDVALREEDRAGFEGGEEGRITVASATGDIGSADGLDAVGCSGRRVPRMRPRPPTEADDGGGGGRRKRQKLGWVVERSRTVLESEFWDQGLLDANAGIGDNGSSNNNNNDLDPETWRLIESSLSVLCLQGGGSVAPHLSFLQDDPRLGYAAGTPQGRAMVDHALGGGDALAAALASDAGTVTGTGDGNGKWRGRTVLHVAALWGDLEGVRAALGMGADPTALDAGGDKPVELARRERDRTGVYDEVALALVEGEERAAAERNVRRNRNGGGEEYYYEVYCLETTGAEGSNAGKEGANPNRGAEEKKDDATANPPSSRAGSQFLRRPRGASAASIPDLERSSVLPEEDDAAKDGRGHGQGGCALIELQKGFGYWNERGELVLEAAPPDGAGQHGGGMTAEEEDERFVRRFYQDGDLSMGDDDEHDSNDEGYDGNDYPDEDASFGLGSDYDDYRDADDYGRGSVYGDDDSAEDDEGNWKMDFRSRFVTRDELDSRYGCFGVDECNDGSDGV